MPKIFINYRRADTQAVANLFHDRLLKTFGDKDVFLDTHDIPAAENWQNALTSSTGSSKIVLVLIGDKWLGENSNENRLFNEEDWVRKEIEYAIDHNLKILPVLINNATMPDKDNLPESLKILTEKQALTLRLDRIDDDYTNILRSLFKILKMPVKRLYHFNKVWILIISSIIIAFLGLIYWSQNEKCFNFQANNEVNAIIYHNGNIDIARKVESRFNQLTEGKFINQVFVNKSNAKKFDTGTLENKTKTCEGDIYLRTFNSDNKVEINVVDDDVQSYMVDNNFSLVPSNARLTEESSMAMKLENCVCILAANVWTKKNNPERANKELELCDFSTESQVVRSYKANLSADNNIAAKNFEAALIDLNSINNIFSNNIEFNKKLALVATQANDHNKATSTLTKLIENRSVSDEDKTYAYYYRANEFINNNETEKANNDYEKINENIDKGVNVDPELGSKIQILKNVLNDRGVLRVPPVRPGSGTVDPELRRRRIEEIRRRRNQ